MRLFVVPVFLEGFLAGVIAPQTVALGREPEFAVAVFVDVDGHGSDTAQPLEVVVLTVVAVQSCHCCHPDSAVAVLEDGVTTRVVERGGIVAPLLIVAQGAGLRIQREHPVGVGAYPQVATVHAEGMHIEFLKVSLMGIVDEAMLIRGKAHQTTVVAGDPYPPVPVFTEAGDDIARQAIACRKALEASAYGRQVVHTAIEGTCPQPALLVARDGIHEAVGQAILGNPQFLHQSPPFAGFRIQADHALVAADADTVV